MRERSKEEHDVLVESGSDETVRMLDWKDGPGATLEAVDELLAAFGLEIVTFDTGADDYLFKIEKKV